MINNACYSSFIFGATNKMPFKANKKKKKRKRAKRAEKCSEAEVEVILAQFYTNLHIIYTNKKNSYSLSRCAY